MDFLKKIFFNKSPKTSDNPQPNNPESCLLPAGFYDLLFDEALKNHRNINIILEGFFANNFQLIKTPLLEFEESLKTNNYQHNLFNNCFRAIDNISGKSLIIRNDITLQINRLLATRLKNFNSPLKLCYVGDVLRSFNDQLYADRQQTQIGCEIIGDNSQLAIFEIIAQTIQALENIGLNNLIINFSLPEFIDIFVNQLNLENSAINNLKHAIFQKNLSIIKDLAKDYYPLIKKLTLENHNFSNLSLLIKNQFNDQLINQELAKAQTIIDHLVNNFKNVAVCFNLFGSHEIEYHNNFAFEIFVENFPYSIAKGGCYKIFIDNNSNSIIDAVGSTIYINHLRKII